jgi:hypothetical protein
LKEIHYTTGINIRKSLKVLYNHRSVKNAQNSAYVVVILPILPVVLPILLEILPILPEIPLNLPQIIPNLPEILPDLREFPPNFPK